MITVTATQIVKSGTENQLELLMKDLTLQVREEPGCISFNYFRSRENPANFLVIEQYKDEKALTLHQQTKYLQEFIPKMMKCLEQPPVVTTYKNVFKDLTTTPTI